MIQTAYHAALRGSLYVARACTWGRVRAAGRVRGAGRVTRAGRAYVGPGLQPGIGGTAEGVPHVRLVAATRLMIAT
jgi:hypothetical protein